MPADVITRVHQMSRRPLALTAIEFADRAGVPLADNINDQEDDENESDDDDDDYDPDVDDDNIAAVDTPDNDDGEDDAPLIAIDDANNAELEMDLEMNNDEVHEDDDSIDQHNVNEEEEIDNEHNANDIEADDESKEDEPVDINARMDATYGPRTSKYDLRARKPRDYGHIHTTLESTIFTQHSVRKGLKMFGDAGVDAVKKELTQLHERGVLAPKELNDEHLRLKI
jgi:hypothetical protein